MEFISLVQYVGTPRRRVTKHAAEVSLYGYHAQILHVSPPFVFNDRKIVPLLVVLTAEYEEKILKYISMSAKKTRTNTLSKQRII